MPAVCCTGYDWRSFRLLITNFWHRLFGTAGIWFCNDWYACPLHSLLWHAVNIKVKDLVITAQLQTCHGQHLLVQAWLAGPPTPLDAVCQVQCL